MGQKRVQKETKTDVPATYGKSGFDMLFVMFQPCQSSRQNHIFMLIRGAKLGCERMSKKIASKVHFGGPGGDLVAPRLIFGSQAKIFEKGLWNARLHP